LTDRGACWLRPGAVSERSGPAHGGCQTIGTVERLNRVIRGAFFTGDGVGAGLAGHEREGRGKSREDLKSGHRFCLLLGCGELYRSVRVTALTRVRSAQFPGSGRGARERWSLAFFLDPNPDAVIEALPGTGAAKYPPVTGAECLRMRLEATYS